MKNNLNTTQTKPLFQLLHRGHLQKRTREWHRSWE